jgi:uncharacterized membrane-anchored protein YhcB (DUF1043 family)
METIILASLGYIEIMGIGLLLIVLVAMGFFLARYAGRSAKDNKKVQEKMNELEKELEAVKQQKESDRI